MKGEINMGISKSTIIRMACLLLALINMVLVNTGHSVLPIDEVWLEEVITDGAVIVTGVVAAWKNNSFTKAAIEGDAVMRAVRILAKHGAECAEELSNGKGEDDE